MSGQIINVSNDEIISEVSLKCGDPFFRDFPKNIYSQAVYRSERSIAKDFGVLDRIWTYTNVDGTSPITISRLNFNGAWRLTITTSEDEEILYTQKQLDEVLDNDDSPTASSNYYYAIIYNANATTLYYTHPAENDTITIYYTSSIAGEEDYETLDSDGNANVLPVLPNKYYEEIIRRAVRYIAQLGLAMFDAIKGQKYEKILTIYTRQGDEQQEAGLQKSRDFIQIKPFQYP